MAAHSGFLISFEGLDGAGKSTQVATLAAWLRARGSQVISVRPDDTALGAVVSGAVLQHARAAALEPWTEALLFTAGRVQLLAESILPALARGAVVIADRFVDSTLAYQGGGRGVDNRALLQLHRECCGDVWPQLTIYLRLPHTVAAGRQRAQQLPLDRFEQAPDEFHRRVQAVFEHLAAENPQRIVAVDATAPAADVSRRVAEIVGQRLAVGARQPVAVQ